MSVAPYEQSPALAVTDQHEVLAGLVVPKVPVSELSSMARGVPLG